MNILRERWADLRNTKIGGGVHQSMPRPVTRQYEHNGYAGLVEQRRARSTGTLVGVYHSAQAGLEDDPSVPWMTVCEDHDRLVGHSSLALARAHAAAPEQWCDRCAYQHGDVTPRQHWEDISLNFNNADSIEENVAERGFDPDSDEFFRECIAEASAEHDL